MRYTFGNCTLDTARRELSRDGVLVALEPKGYQVLLYLIEHCERVVTRDDLLAHAWPDVYVVDTTVARCLTLIRKAVGDSGATQQIIKTLHGHGYRFVASVRAHEAQQTQAPAAPVLAEPRAPSIPADPRAPSFPAERRHVSVLGAALTPAFALLAGVDVELQQALLEQLDAAVRRAAAPYDGQVQQITSDRFSVVFGTPRAQEDHAERAVLAALAIRRRWIDLGPTFAATLGQPIALGMAIHTGTVVVPPAESATNTTSLAGEVLPLAEQLARHASGTILISAAVAPLVGAVARIGAPTSVAVAGRPQPVPAFTVDGAAVRPPPGTAIGVRHHGPFIGRQSDLAILRTHLDHVLAGHGRSVGIVGPPGMGKTRLVAQFLRGLDAHACRVVYGRCQSHGQHTPGLPLVDLLRQWWSIEEADTLATVATKASAVLREAGVAPDASEPLLRLLGAITDAAPAKALSPQELRAQTFAALHALFAHGSERKVLVVFIDDVHWIDATSEAYLAELAGRVAARRLLLLTTFRPGYRPPWQTQSTYGQLALAPLAEEESRALVRATRRGPLLQGALETTIVARSQGNPFFVEALTRAVVDDPGANIRLALPATIQSILEARIDRLPAPAKHLLQVAAVIGADVPRRLLRDLAGLPEAVMDDSLLTLQTAEMLFEQRSAPESTYAFQHALVQDVAYQSLLGQTRRDLHRRAVASLEAQAAHETAQAQRADTIDPLAYHAVQGELWEPALRYSEQAGKRAFARGSNAEAAAAFDQAIAACEHLPQDRATLERAIDLRFALRSTLLNLGGFARILTCVREAERLARAIGDDQRLAQAAFFLSLHLYLQGDHAAAVEAGQRAQALTAGRDPIVHALATYLVGIPLQAQGRHVQAVECFEQSLGALDGTKRLQFYNLAVLPSVTSCAFLASSLSELGRFERAREFAAQGLEIAATVGHPPSVMFASWGAGWAAFRQGDSAAALAHLERAVAICRDAGLVLHFPMVAVPLASARLLAGHTGAAVELLTQTLERIVAHDLVNFQGVCRYALAEALLAAGRIDAAGELAVEALAVVRRQGERGYEAYTLRVLGAIEQRRGSVGMALERFGDSLRLADALGLAPLQAHCLADMATAYAGLGRLQQAREAIAEACLRYRALAMRWHEDAAESLRARLG